MSVIRSSRIFYINSRNRLEGTDSDFSYHIDMGTNANYNRVVCMKAGIPKSYYLVQDGFNTFTLTEAGTPITITIPVSNYKMTAFKTVLQALLRSQSTHGWIYTVTAPSNAAGNTGKFIYTVTGNAGSQPSITVTNGLFEQLGFNHNSTNTFVGDTLTSTNVLKFVLEDVVYIHSDICTNGRDDILCVVESDDSQDFSSIRYSCTAHEALSRGVVTTTSSSYRFRLTDEDGIPLNLNGLNWTMVLLLWEK